MNKKEVILETVLINHDLGGVKVKAIEAERGWSQQSISGTLSTLKNEGKVFNKNGNWFAGLSNELFEVPTVDYASSQTQFATWWDHFVSAHVEAPELEDIAHYAWNAGRASKKC